jgi:hypothetical protein
MMPWSPVSQGQPGLLERRLVPEASLGGRMTEADGAPPENVSVRLGIWW